MSTDAQEFTVRSGPVAWRRASFRIAGHSYERPHVEAAMSNLPLLERHEMKYPGLARALRAALLFVCLLGACGYASAAPLVPIIVYYAAGEAILAYYLALAVVPAIGIHLARKSEPNENCERKGDEQ